MTVATKPMRSIGKRGTGTISNRPRVAQEITDLVLRMARQTVSWGYDRMQGAHANLGHIIASNTVKNILKRHGIETAPEREKRTSWATFLKAHWDVMAATDFFTVEVWTSRGLMTCYVLFIIHLSTRYCCWKMKTAGIVNRLMQQ